MRGLLWNKESGKSKEADSNGLMQSENITKLKKKVYDLFNDVLGLLLISNGATIDATDFEGRTALYLASSKGFTILTKRV